MQPKIAIVGYPPFSELARDLLIDIPQWVKYEITELPLKFLSSPDSIRDLQSFFDPATIVVSGDRSAISLKQALTNLIIPVKMSGFDLLEIIKNVGTNETVIMNFGEDIKELSAVSSLLKVKIRQIHFNDIQDAYNILEHLRSEGIMNVVGGSWVCTAARQLGMNGIFYYTHRAMENAILDAINILKVYRTELESLTLFKTMVNLNRSGIISTDSDSRIQTINKVTERLLGITINQAQDKKIAEIIPNITSKDPVSKWNEPQFNLIFEHNNQKIMADIMPVILHGENMGHLIALDDVIKLQEKEQKIRKNITQKPMVANYSYEDIIGTSKTIKDTIQQAKKFSHAHSSILIHGESGTGKELFAQSIHSTSSRNLQPFVAVNCAALPESLIDSELFGYEEGSFTGAKKGGKVGLFELAHQGTIFLDEISELPLHLQSRLLRVLQEKEIVRIGGDRVIPINVRIIAASNKNLLDCVKEGTFREDLYFRISVLQLYLPPLRKRTEDIAKLFHHFIKSKNHQPTTFDRINLELLDSYHWPGNVRELENVAERFLVLCQGEKLTDDSIQEILNMALFPSLSASPSNYNRKNLLLDESELIETALVQSDGNREKAAELLGISRTTLWRKMKKELKEKV